MSDLWRHPRAIPPTRMRKSQGEGDLAAAMAAAADEPPYPLCLRGSASRSASEPPIIPPLSLPEVDGRRLSYASRSPDAYFSSPRPPLSPRGPPPPYASFYFSPPPGRGSVCSAADASASALEAWDAVASPRFGGLPGEPTTPPPDTGRRSRSASHRRSCPRGSTGSTTLGSLGTGSLGSARGTSASSPALALGKTGSGSGSRRENPLLKHRSSQVGEVRRPRDSVPASFGSGPLSPAEAAEAPVALPAAASPAAGAPPEPRRRVAKPPTGLAQLLLGSNASTDAVNEVAKTLTLYTTDDDDSHSLLPSPSPIESVYPQGHRASASTPSTGTRSRSSHTSAMARFSQASLYEGKHSCRSEAAMSDVISSARTARSTFTEEHQHRLLPLAPLGSQDVAVVLEVTPAICDSSMSSDEDCAWALDGGGSQVLMSRGRVEALCDRAQDLVMELCVLHTAGGAEAEAASAPAAGEAEVPATSASKSEAEIHARLMRLEAAVAKPLQMGPPSGDELAMMRKLMDDMRMELKEAHSEIATLKRHGSGSGYSPQMAFHKSASLALPPHAAAASPPAPAPLVAFPGARSGPPSRLTSASGALLSPPPTARPEYAGAGGGGAGPRPQALAGQMHPQPTHSTPPSRWHSGSYQPPALPHGMPAFPHSGSYQPPVSCNVGTPPLTVRTHIARLPSTACQLVEASTLATSRRYATPVQAYFPVQRGGC